MTRTRLAAALAVLALGIAGLAGCGGSNDSGNDAEGDTTALTDTVSTEESVATEETSTESTATETAATDTSDSLAGLSGECKDLAQAGEKFSAAIQSSTGGVDSDLEATAEAYKEFADQAPDEIKDDLQVLSKVILVYATAFKDIDLKPGAVPNAEQIAKLTKLSQSFNSAEAQKASAAVAAWIGANCGTSP